jgi:hypothetical protein
MTRAIASDTEPRIRQAHEVRFDEKGRVEPLQRLSAAESASVERAGYEIIRQDLAPTWGEFGTLARSGNRYYLLALA